MNKIKRLQYPLTNTKRKPPISYHKTERRKCLKWKGE